VNVQSVRFYERRRILRQPARTSSGYRIYSNTDLEDICFVKQCQQLGFTLNEIRPLLQLHRAAAQPVPAGRRTKEFLKIGKLAAQKVQQIDDKMRALMSVRQRLLRMLSVIEDTESVSCPAAPLAKLTSPSKSRS